MMASIKAVILDLDQTLTSDTGSWLQFTSLIGADPSVHAEIYDKYKSGFLEYKKAKAELIKLWEDTGRINKEDIEKVFRKIKLRKGALDAVTYLKRKYKLCLISGAIDVFVKVFSEKLGIDFYYSSTKFVFDENGKLMDFNYLLGRGEEKLNFLRKFCRKNKLSFLECAAIGDGESDMPIFEKVGLPILFVAAETSNQQKRKYINQIDDWRKISKFL